MKKNDLITLNYTAGLFDGEGSVLLSYKNKKDKFRTQCVSLTSTTYPLVEFLKENYEGYICNQKIYKKHHKKAWIWKLSGRKAVDFLNKIYPYLKETDKIYRAKLIATKYPQVTLRNGKYNIEQLQYKKDFENAFYHPSKPLA